jgi:uncharacterized protein
MTVKVGSINVNKGEKSFGGFSVGETRGRFPAEIPMHVIQGANDGPVLLVQAGLSGLEIEPAMVLPKLVEELDPSSISGTLILVPLLNTSGFEFQHVHSAWDGKNLNEIGRGDANGSVNEKLFNAYYEQAVSQADAVVDIHTGALWSYYRYAGVYETGSADKSRNLAMALGLPQVLVNQPHDNSIAFEAAKDGKAVVTAWIGGGPGFRDFRHEDQNRVRNAVTNAMKHLGMLDGNLQSDDGKPAVLKGHTFLHLTGERGFTLVAKDKRGQKVSAGDQIALIKHPFTGDIVEEITAPRDGVLLHAGAVWPMVPEGELLAIIGEDAG